MRPESTPVLLTQPAQLRPPSPQLLVYGFCLSRTRVYANADALPQPERACRCDGKGRCACAEGGDVGRDARQLGGWQCAEEGNVRVELVQVRGEVRGALGGQGGVVGGRLEQGEDVDLRLGVVVAAAAASGRRGGGGGGAGLVLGPTGVGGGGVGFVVRGSGPCL